jgi:hypothetical protein
MKSRWPNKEVGIDLSETQFIESVSAGGLDEAETASL